MVANLYTKKAYEENSDSGHEKTKPIQTQLKPIQSQLKPIQTQFKPKQTQSCPPQADSKPDQSLKDIQEFFEKLPVMVLTNSGK